MAEQKLAEHPDVFGMGEVGSFIYLGDQLAKGTTVPDRFAGYDQQTVLAAAKKYLAEIPSEGQSHARAVNKLPANYIHLGIIATLFPNAKIIHCRRNVMDSGFSCYQQNFKAGNLRYTTKLDDLAEVIQQYLSIMEHYRELLPIEVFELDYEKMVDDPDYWTGALYEFIGVAPSGRKVKRKEKRRS
ncbi:MAG: sulfotransferase family protein [Hyphomicrobiales bacterium]